MNFAHRFLIVRSTILLVLFFLGCENTQPIKVGFVGGLTGRHSDLGITGRDGVIFAVEEINRSGGLNGRRVVLVSRDDKQDPEVALLVDKELIEENVTAIIGHMTSAMSIAIVPLINKEKKVVISPTTSTNQLTGIDDYFLRVTSPSKSAITYLAEHMYKSLGLKRVVVVYDITNRAFSEEWYTMVSEIYKETGSGQVFSETFSAGSSVRFSEVADRILDNKPDGIVIVAASLDTAMLCQQLKKAGSKTPVFSTMWAMTEDFIQHGGNAAEGVIFAHWFYKEYGSAISKKFRSNFEERFGYPPNFASHFSYEASQVLFKALSINDNPQVLKDTIISQKVYKGTQGDIRIDKYGDPQRKVFLMAVKDGHFIAME